MLQFITEQGLQELSTFVVRKVILIIKHNQEINKRNRRTEKPDTVSKYYEKKIRQREGNN